MKIDNNDIAIKKTAGTTKDGKPIIYVYTHGGLHALFSRDKDGSVVSLAAAPHIAIMKFLAEKKEDGIKWEQDFDKPDTVKSESTTNLFERARTVFFAPAGAGISNTEDNYMVYDIPNVTMQVMTKSEILDFYKKGNIVPVMVRNLSLKDGPILLNDFLEKNR